MTWVWVRAFNILLISYLLLAYYHGFILSLAVDDASNWTSLAIEKGYISIDCGSEPDAVTPGYKSDETFIDTGKNMPMAPEQLVNGIDPIYRTLRSFPNGVRNCYTLKPLEGINNKYLIRAMFMYGNYDQLNQRPVFHIYVGVTLWGVVSFNNTDERIFKEIIYKPTTKFIDICLINIDQGTPIISELVLRPLNSNIYSTKLGALHTDTRFKSGPFALETGYKSDPNDIYDRFWSFIPQGGFSDWVPFNTSTDVETLRNDEYKVPPNLLMSPAMPRPGIMNMVLYQTPDNPTSAVYFYLHFVEIEKHNRNVSRELEIFYDGNSFGKIRLEYMKALTVVSPPITLVPGRSNIRCTINQTNNASTLRPILNALEIFSVINISHEATNQDDVKIITEVREKYSVIKGWNGDPCLPMVPWDGLNCSNNNTINSLRITSLNLSSKGLVGEILPSLSGLTSLIYLNLSHNSLTGKIPESLANLPSLKFLDLRGNNLSGPVPAGLTYKMNNGILSLSLDNNPNPCASNSCTEIKRKKHNVVAPLVASTTLFVILVAVTVYYTYRWKRNKGFRSSVTKSEGRMKSKNRQFTYSEVLRMTNNFERIIGKGGYGTVYYGSLKDSTEVAVKMLNQPSAMTSFRTEAEVLMRVHHKNLVSLIGYCDERNIIALIYEYMPNGNLQQHLSGQGLQDYNSMPSWKKRLQISIDAAQGLDYLHNGSKPAIVHRDLKTANILLDGKLQAKIADFGMSKIFATESASHISTDHVVGTMGYLDPEYQVSYRLNEKSDVYSFGVILLELITGQPAIIKGTEESIHITNWVTPLLERGDIHNIVDQRFGGDFSINSAWKALETAMSCVPSMVIQRPTMAQVLADLKDSLTLELAYEKTRGGDDTKQPNSYGDNNFETIKLDSEENMHPSPR